MLLKEGVANGTRLLSEDAIRQMTTVQSKDLYPNQNVGYGQGWEIQRNPGDVLPPGSFFHRGARSTKMWVDPTDELAMVLLTERMDMPGQDQENMYNAFLKAAVQKYGRGGGQN
jgi:CubicO group peptidase (beta-lactamase class C family)